MADPKIKINILADAKNAQSGLKDAGNALDRFKADVASAEGAGGKFKAGFGSALSSVKANAMEFGVAAGAAIIAFGVKSVKAFQDTALAAGKFSDTSGLAIEDASAWMEVAGDVGVATDTMSSLFQKFNKNLADGKDTFAEYGIEVVKTKDGIVDVNESFIEAATAIGNIEDPTKRTQAAQEVFGKSWGEVSELMSMDADELREALNSVGDSKIIDEEELQKAKNLRDAIDRLKGFTEDLELAFGEFLAGPGADAINTFSDMADQIKELNTAVEDLTGSDLVYWLGETLDALMPLDNQLAGTRRLFGENRSAAERFAGGLELIGGSIPVVGEGVSWLTNKLFGLADASKEAAGEGEEHKVNIDFLTDGLKGTANPLKDFTDAIIALAKEENKGTAATEAFNQSINDLQNDINGERSFLNALDDLDAYNQKMKDGTLTERERRQAYLDMTDSALRAMEALGEIPAEKRTEIMTYLDQGKFDEAMWVIGSIPKDVDVRVNVKVPPGQSVIPKFGAYAKGTQFAPGGMAVVGEEGPELMDVPTGAKIYPAGKTASMLGGQGVYNDNRTINVQVASMTPEGINALQARYNRRNGVS